MGTNYYITTRGNCPHCGQVVADLSKELHVGKQSAGWVFQLRVYRDGEGPPTLRAWLPILSGPELIFDEYDSVVPVHKLLDMIYNPEEDACRNDQPDTRHGPSWDEIPHEFS